MYLDIYESRSNHKAKMYNRYQKNTKKGIQT